MRTVFGLVGVAGLLALSGCSGSSTAQSAPPPTSSAPTGAATATATPSATPAPTATSAAPSPTARPGCAAKGTGTPKGATSKAVVDVDGDGRRDTGFITQGKTQGDQVVGITTASGATFTTTFASASPVERRVLVADVDGRGTIAVLLDDGRSVSLDVVHDCSIVPATNPQGDHYVFSLGVTDTGTGVGCSQVRGTSHRSLVGLNAVADRNGTVTTIGRTQVVIDGTHARNGAHDTVPGGPRGSAAVASATAVSCGDLSVTEDGFGLPE